jgi:hypothetical protein
MRPMTPHDIRSGSPLHARVRVCASICWGVMRCQPSAAGRLGRTSWPRRPGCRTAQTTASKKENGWGAGPILFSRRYSNRPHPVTRDFALLKPGVEGNPMEHKPKQGVTDNSIEGRRTCGARTRSGGLCRRSPSIGRRRCKLHGGAPNSGAPFGERNGNWKGGRYSKAGKAARLAEGRLAAPLSRLARPI